jgi:rare lipoprotein A
MRRLAPILLAALALLTGCAHKKQTARVPPPPNLPRTSSSQPPSSRGQQTAPETATIAPHAGEKPLLVETGLASWYGPPYHNRRGANGEIFDMNQMTAAHRTLPLNSLVRVTNIKTHRSAIVRITDRGPFIGQRMLDLSMAAAKAIDVWAPGTAWVRMEVLETPAPIATGGKWAVQIGAFNTVESATDMKQRLMRRYRDARVLEFAGPTGEWVRIRVPNDDRERAAEISQAVSTSEGGVFLVRLD